MSVAAHALYDLYAPVRVVVAMPHARLRAAITGALDSTGSIAVVAGVSTIEEAIRLAREARPDAVLVGTSLLGGDVVQDVRSIVRALSGVPVVITGHEDRAAYVAAVMAGGAAAYVPLHGDADAFAEILGSAAAGAASRSHA